jgi:uncharacterized cofD-like protein
MKIVAIGGGTGLSTVLRGLKHYLRGINLQSDAHQIVSRLTAVVTVTDEGGSSGRLRREFRILPPGDIRNCMVALAEDEKLLTQLFNYRFSAGHGLKGHSFGNLFLAALTHLTRDFAHAVRFSSEVLAIRGEIFPSTLSDVRLKAEQMNGKTIYGEASITKTRIPIRRLHLVPSRCQPLPETLEAIEQADLVTVGPGSLYTSLIPNLLVRRITEVIVKSKARKVYVCNLMTQPGESRGYSAADHLRALHQHAGRKLFDVVILNRRPVSAALRKRYAAEGAAPVVNDLAEVEALGVTPLLADGLLEDHVVRHDPARLAKLLLSLAGKRR